MGAVLKVEVPQTLPVIIAILDPLGRILGVNEAWKNFGERNGLRVPDFGVGDNYLNYCKSDQPHSLQFIDNLKELLAGRLDLITRVYPCHSPAERHWFFLIGLPLSLNDRSGVALLHIDLTPFLLLPMTGHGEPPGMAGRARTDLSIDLGTVAGSVEHSSLEALSSQLRAMLAAIPQASSEFLRRDNAAQTLEHARLSERQLQVLGLLAEGKTNTEIAKALYRSPNTIKLHVSAILRHLNVNSRTQAALLASKLLKNSSRRNGPS
jgi:DNA-binding CsgD family transcriptional regulator